MGPTGSQTYGATGLLVSLVSGKDYNVLDELTT
jgi:hypothetical protein